MKRAKIIILAALLCISAYSLNARQSDRNPTDLAVIDCSEVSYQSPGGTYQAWCVVANNGTEIRNAKTGMNIYRNGLLIESWPNFDVYNLPVGETREVYFPEIFPSVANAQYKIIFTVDCFPIEDDNPIDNQMETAVYTWNGEYQKPMIELASGVANGQFEQCYGAVLGTEAFSFEDVATLNHQHQEPYSNSASEDRIAYYEVQSFPTAIFNGSLALDYGSSTESLYPFYETALISQSSPQAPVELRITGQNTGSLYSFTIYVDRIAWLENHSWQLFLAITEDDLPVNWMGLTRLNNVTRHILPSASSGYQITFDDSNPDYITQDISLQMDSGINIENCNIVVWLQDMDSPRIVQANSIHLSDMPPPVSSSDPQLSPAALSFEVYPNPIHHSATIRLESKSSGPFSLELFNLRGQVLSSRTYDQLPQGKSTIDWQPDSARLSSGIYYLRLTDSHSSVSRKVVVLN